ncbi:alpha-amylase [Cryomorpha ignava]|uniref:Alpha-amylase n=1 Tax=Cryomorpha ignava TaxID=101383 RepID=A0A7K3WP68_9FLAO|nr:alpha-amylase family glycosyl hydrolase [Cryomorpha ignava]NEN22525.1 alpha-amylase [Cryomorpha ignava]
MIKQLGILALAVLIFGCSDEDKMNAKKEIISGSDIVGLASPIKLSYDSTTVFLLDYFQDAAKIDSVILPANAEYSFDKEKATIEITDFENGDPLSLLSVIYSGKQYDIPVFKSRDLPFRYTYESMNPGAGKIALKGNFNGWNQAATPLQKDDDSWSANLILEPGLYEYLVVEDGKEMLDPNNPNKKDNGQGGFNSTFRVGSDTGVPHISTYGFLGDSIVIHFPSDLENPFIFWNNHRLDTAWYRRNGDRLSIDLPAASAEAQRSDLRVFAHNGEQRTNDILIPLQKGKPLENPTDLPRSDKQKLAMYFMMVDRFVDADKENDLPVNDPEILPPANYYGGDLEGVDAKIKDGYLKDLGMNTVWLSPIAQNPLGAYGLWDKGGVRSKFSGYHGYWPISSSQVDFRFGDAQILEKLIDRAHNKDMNVILDYVANHVHEEHPVYKQHPDWATNLYLPDGSLNTEKWDEHRLTTWFDTFMPTLDFSRPEVIDAMTDSALFWFQNYQLDGFRHDATKHIQLEFWRELTRKLKYQVILPNNRPVYQIGETYGNAQLIDSYVGSGLLDAQFDFNLYDAAVGAFAKDDGSIENLNRVLNQSLSVYGNHHSMGNISGNQDRTRFISYADGSVDFGEDPKLAGWTRKIEIKDNIGYSRLAMLHAFNFTIPGVPVIYYGDEIGMPGANDPDNRRMMRFGKDLNKKESELLKTVTKIANLRQEKMALLYGDLVVLNAGEKEFVYLRNYFKKTAIVFFNTSRKSNTISVEIPEYYSLENIKANFGHKIKIDGRKITIELPPVSYEILTN